MLYEVITGKEITNEVWNPERDDVRVHLIASAKARGEDLVSDESKNPAGEGGGPGESG